MHRPARPLRLSLEYFDIQNWALSSGLAAGPVGAVCFVFSSFFFFWVQHLWSHIYFDRREVHWEPSAAWHIQYVNLLFDQSVLNVLSRVLGHHSAHHHDVKSPKDTATLPCRFWSRHSSICDPKTRFCTNIKHTINEGTTSIVNVNTHQRLAIRAVLLVQSLMFCCSRFTMQSSR